MIVLHTVGPALGLPDPSPFVLKTMIHLRMAGLAFEVKRGIGSLRRSPRQKLPFIEDNGQVISDSSVIRAYLEQTYNIDLDAGYDERDRATAYAVQKLLEESVYFAGVQRRWIRADGWALVKAELLGGIPAPIRWFVVPRIQKQVRRTLYGQGTGRMTDAEIDAIYDRGWDAISTLLGDRPYFLGERPSAVDATILAFLITGTASALPGPMRDSIVGRANLLAYRDRLKRQYFTDFQFAD